ncbi:putative reverse transcriptase domain-containing protein [Tanacetum coccineum]
MEMEVTGGGGGRGIGGNRNGGNRDGGNGNGGNRNGGNRNGGNGNGNGNGGEYGYNFRRFMPARECTYQDFLKCHPLNFNGMEGVVRLTRWFEKMETVFHISNCPEKYQNGPLTKRKSVEHFIGGYQETFQVRRLQPNPVRFQDAVRIANQLMDKKLQGYAAKSEQGVKRRELERPRHFRNDCPKLRNQNRGNQTRNRVGNKTGNQIRGNEATAKAYAIGGGGTNPDSNVVTGTFLLNNYYASMLFDSGADRSFVLSTFSALLDITPSTLDTSYAVELSDGRISKTNVVLRGCTLGLLGHPFDINLMPIELGSIDVIIGMDWLAKYYALIVCDEKVVRIPYGDKVLIIRGDDYDNGSKLNIISCTKTQKYIQKGMFRSNLAQLTSKKPRIVKEKLLEDVPINTGISSPFQTSCLEYHLLEHVEFKLLSPWCLQPVPHSWGITGFALSKRKDDLSVYSMIDLRFGHTTQRYREEDIPKTAFRTRYIRDRVYQRHFDILQESRKEHEGHLRLILKLLKEDKLYAKFLKCEFWLSKVQFLGHVIDSEGIYVDPAKIESIKDWASPKTTTKIRQFLGLAEKAEAAFQLLKQKLCSAPILALLEGSENFVVYCDASHKGLGAVLMQREKVIAYASRQLKVHEKNYTTQDLELGVVVFALKRWRYYVYGTKYVVFTDHKSPQHILDQKELNMRQRRWLELLSDYDCEIRYHPGKANVVADALSQKERIKPLQVRALVMTISLDLPKQILSAQSEARKEENFINEDLHGMINKLEPHADGTLYLNN